MGRERGSERTPGSGRKAGTPNKVTGAVREMTLEALEQLGGVDYLISLGKTEPAVFGGLLRRCMPQAIEATIDASVSTLEIIDLSDMTPGSHALLSPANPVSPSPRERTGPTTEPLDDKDEAA